MLIVRNGTFFLRINQDVKDMIEEVLMYAKK